VDLDIVDARRVAIAAQGFRPRRPGAGVGPAQLRRLVHRMQVIQLDPISVLVRAQYLPAFARLGPYPRALLDRMSDGAHELFEYMVHDASLVPVGLYRLLEWRMDAWRHDPSWLAVEPLARTLLAQVAARGPVAVSDLVEGPPVRMSGAGGPWGKTSWAHDPAKGAMRRLWMTGQVLPVGRRGTQPVYDLRERVLPEAVRADPLPVNEARKELLVLAGRALGVGVGRDLADYFRFGRGSSGRADRWAPGAVPVPRLLDELVEEGRLLRCRVEGWRDDAYLDPSAPPPRRQRVRALFGPFDPMVWERPRAKRLFDLEYTAEIYLPAGRRVHGYYVLPFLLGEAIVARVDLKADRATGSLLVQAAHAQPGVEATDVDGPLAAELADLAAWLGLERVSVMPRGDLAGPLAGAVASR
jgi:uncharacterized protein YcaQ